MTRIRTAVAVALAAIVTVPTPALAHKGDPNFLSSITDVSGLPEGADVSIVNREDGLLLVNRSGTDLLVRGYEDEPYARIAADGTVSVNEDSEVSYLNRERDGIVDVPDSEDGGAPTAAIIGFGVLLVGSVVLVVVVRRRRAVQPADPGRTVGEAW